MRQLKRLAAISVVAIVTFLSLPTSAIAQTMALRLFSNGAPLGPGVAPLDPVNFPVWCELQISYEGAWSYSDLYIQVGSDPIAHSYYEVYGDFTGRVETTVAASTEDRVVHCWVTSNLGSDSIGGTLRAGCGGSERDTIVNEYITYGVTPRPFCTDFATGGGGTYFSWADLNIYPGSGHPPYGIVTIFTPLDATREYYGGRIIIDSGYRCPHGNAAVGGAFNPPSRHMFGDAADMKSIDVPWNFNEWNNMRVAALAAGFTYFEPYADDPSHLHVDRR